MTHRHRHRRPIPVAPGQTTLDAMLRAYPEAIAVRVTPTGRALALLAGGAPAPASPVVTLRARRAAA